MTPEPLRIRLLPSAAGAEGPQFTTSYLIGNRVAIDAGCVGIQASLETQLASDEDPMVRRNAAWALGRVEPNSRSLRDALEREEDAGVRGEITRALGG